MPITPTNPIIEPPVAARTFDGLWLHNLHVTAPAPGNPVGMTADLLPYVTATGELAPASAGVRIVEADLYELPYDDTVKAAVAAAMAAVLHAMELVAKAQGRI